MTITASTTTTTTTTVPAAPAVAPAATFTLNRVQLADVLATVGVAIDKRPVTPIMVGATFTVDADGTLTVSGHSFDVSATVTVPTVGPFTPGTVLLSHAELTAMVAAAVKGEVKRDADKLTFTVTVVETHTPTAVKVTTGGEYVDGARTPVVTTFTGEIVDVVTTATTLTVAGYGLPLAELDATEYPACGLDAPVDADKLTTVTVDRAALTALTTTVGGAAGKDDTLPMLTGVKLEISEGTLTLAATDRFRLSVGSVPVTVHTDRPIDYAVGRLVPFVTLAAMLKRCTGDTLTLTFADGSDTSGAPVTIGADGVTYRARTLDATFPRFRQLAPAPEDVSCTLTVDRDALARAVRKGSAFLAAKGDKGAAVRLTVTADGVMAAPMVDGATGPLLSGTVVGEPITIGVNPAYCLDALAAADTVDGAVVLRFTRPARPVTFTAPGVAPSDDGAAWQLVMPVRLGE